VIGKMMRCNFCKKELSKPTNKEILAMGDPTMKKAIRYCSKDCEEAKEILDSIRN